MKAKKMAKETLLRFLQGAIDAIGEDDSYEGSIEYSCLDESCGKHEFMVLASVRVGNAMGQGRCILIGDADG